MLDQGEREMNERPRQTESGGDSRRIGGKNGSRSAWRLPLFCAAPAFADEKPIKIGFIVDKTGPLEAYAKQTVAGFAMGLDYATDGTMTVAGHKLIVIEKDSQTKPDVGRNLLERGL